MGFEPRFQNMWMNLMLVKQQNTKHKNKTHKQTSKRIPRLLWCQDSTPEEINYVEQSDKDFEITMFRSSERYMKYDFS